MNNSNHTPTPWMLSDKPGGKTGIISSAGEYIAFYSEPIRKVDQTRHEGESWLDMRTRTAPQREAIIAESKANGRFIVKACNHHEELVEALRYFLRLAESGNASIEPESYADLIALRAKLEDAP